MNKNTVPPEGQNSEQTRDLAGSSSHDLLAVEGDVTQYVGQEWVKPNCYMEGGICSRPFSGYVSMQTSIGWLVLAKVEKVIAGPNRGQIRRTWMQATDFNEG